MAVVVGRLTHTTLRLPLVALVVVLLGHLLRARQEQRVREVTVLTVLTAEVLVVEVLEATARYTVPEGTGGPLRSRAVQSLGPEAVVGGATQMVPPTPVTVPHLAQA